jgi:protein translocase SEC61 complex gamma subunit
MDIKSIHRGDQNVLIYNHEVKEHIWSVSGSAEGEIFLKIREFLSSCRRLILILTKPSRGEIWGTFKTSLLGIAIIGGLGFVIKFLATILQISAT